MAKVNVSKNDANKSSDTSLIVEKFDEIIDDQLFLDLSEFNSNKLLNHNLHLLNKSATLEINERCIELEKSGKHIYRFGLGQSPFPVPEVAVQALRDNAHVKDYLPVQGLPALRECIAQFYQNRTYNKIEKSQVIIGPGSKELLFLIQLCFTGDLIIPSPCWVSYIPQAIILKKDIRILRTSYENRWRVSAAQLRNLCEEDKITKNAHPRMLLINYPGNPDGETYSSDELRDLAAVAKEYNILILSDEIYGDLNFNGDHVSIASFYPEGTIVSTGISKWAAAGGWRLGAFIFPKKLEWLQKAMAVVASETYTSVSAPIQHAAVHLFLQNPDLDAYRSNVQKILQFIGLWCTTSMREVNLKLHTPKGAFYLFIDFEFCREKLIKIGISNSKQMTEHLLDQTGVALLPGVEFARPLEELTVRLAYVNFDGDQALKAYITEYSQKELDLNFIKTYCPDTYNGIRAIQDWVRNL